MTDLSVAEVRLVMLSCVRRSIAVLGISDDRVTDEFDLRSEGVVDSLGFLQLIAEMEQRLGCAIDFSEMDPDHLTLVGPLSAYIAQQCSRSAK
jgi:acyl carrier protein